MYEPRLIYPMLAMVLLTFIVLIVMFRRRVRMVREGHAPASYFRAFQGSQEPDYAVQASRHFANLFEAPVLFYAGCLAAMIVGVKGAGVVTLAWGYVVCRVLHAWIHLGPNRLRHRMRVYFVSWLLLLAIWGLVAVEATQRG
jgi:hypothetical protein